MRLIFWLIRFLVLLVVQLLLSLLAAVFRFLLLPLLLAVISLLGSLVFFSISAVVTGPRHFIDRQAGEWTEQIYEGSNNRDHLSQVFQFCRVLVGTLIVLGWSLAGFFTYTILRVVFVFFT